MAGEWISQPLEDCMAALIDYRGKTPAKTSFGIPLITAKVGLRSPRRPLSATDNKGMSPLSHIFSVRWDLLSTTWTAGVADATIKAAKGTPGASSNSKSSKSASEDWVPSI